MVVRCLKKIFFLRPLIMQLRKPIWKARKPIPSSLRMGENIVLLWGLWLRLSLMKYSRQGCKIAVVYGLVWIWVIVVKYKARVF